MPAPRPIFSSLDRPEEVGSGASEGSGPGVSEAVGLVPMEVVGLEVSEGLGLGLEPSSGLALVGRGEPARSPPKFAFASASAAACSL